MNCRYEVLSPWAEIDPVPLKGISSRLADLNNKTIGLFSNGKPSAFPILNIIREKIKEKFPAVNFSRFEGSVAASALSEPDLKARVQEWAKGVDAAILAVGD